MKDIAKIKFWTTFKLAVKQNYAVTLQWYSYADGSIFHISPSFFPGQGQKDIQSTYNVTLRRVREHCRKKPINMCVRVRACTRARGSVHARACMYVCLSSMQLEFAILWRHLRPLWLSHIFRFHLINGTIFEKRKLLKVKCVFWFSLQLLSKTFLILRRIQRHIFINVKTSSSRVPVTFVGF